MSTNTYVALQTQVLGSAQSSVTFNSIPQTYTDLVLISSGVLSSGSLRGILCQLNGDTGTNYSGTFLDGDGSSASSSRDTNDGSLVAGLSSNINTWTNITHFMNYSNTTTYKTVLARANTPNYVRAAVSLWRSTAAINSIKIFDSAYNFNTGSTFSLYGIQSA